MWLAKYAVSKQIFARSEAPSHASDPGLQLLIAVPKLIVAAKSSSNSNHDPARGSSSTSGSTAQQPIMHAERIMIPHFLLSCI